MDVLFQTYSLGRLELRNRFVRGATFEGMCTPEGVYTPALIDLYERLAAAGIGLILTGMTAVHPCGRSAPNMALLPDSIEAEDALARLVERIHHHGARICLQLGHAGRSSVPLGEFQDIVAPSAVRAPMTDLVPRPLETEEIRTLVEGFAFGAEIARRLGFDAVEIHAAHGYLLSQFLSPFLNQRTDTYGGTLENRARFLMEVVEAVRDAVGPHFPMLVKLNGEDFVPRGGLKPPEAVRVAQMLEARGVDALEITGGTWDSEKGLGSMRKGIPQRHPEAYFRPQAEAIRKRARIPLLLVGGIRSPQVARDLVSSGAVDLVSLSRPFIHEPELIMRWAQGDTRPSGCVSCNRCLVLSLVEGFGCHKKQTILA